MQHTTELATQVGAILDELGKRFGATGEHLWEVIVRQQRIEAGLVLASSVLFIVFTGLLLRWWFKREMKDTYDGDGERLMRVISTGILGIGVVALSIWSIYKAGAFFNPEFYALQWIMSAF